MSIRVNSQSNWSEHNNSFSQKTVLVLEVASSVDPHEMMHHATFLLGLHCLPNYIFRCEKWCEARSINPKFHTLCLLAATALTRLHVCADWSDRSLFVDGISTNIPDIMRKRLSKISDEKEL